MVGSGSQDPAWIAHPCWEGCLSEVAGLIYLIILVATICWNIFWPSYSFNAAVDDIQDMNLTETVDTVEEAVADLFDQD